MNYLFGIIFFFLSWTGPAAPFGRSDRITGIWRTGSELNGEELSITRDSINVALIKNDHVYMQLCRSGYHMKGKKLITGCPGKEKFYFRIRKVTDSTMTIVHHGEISVYHRSIKN